ncbi:MAG: hypothetical protein JSV19_08795 [Phycisphaerales bacterium]|nr:MAG: hypothetical protein JSV19_08795 [Phycisphaerales bacterium]
MQAILCGAIVIAETELASGVPNDFGGDDFSRAAPATRQPVLSTAALYPEDRIAYKSSGGPGFRAGGCGPAEVLPLCPFAKFPEVPVRLKHADAPEQD